MSKSCENCGAHVSNRFARVFGDNDNNVLKCIRCIKKSGGSVQEELAVGAAGKEDCYRKRSMNGVVGN